MKLKQNKQPIEPIFRIKRKAPFVVLSGTIAFLPRGYTRWFNLDRLNDFIHMEIAIRELVNNGQTPTK